MFNKKKRHFFDFNEVKKSDSDFEEKIHEEEILDEFSMSKNVELNIDSKDNAKEVINDEIDISENKSTNSLNTLSDFEDEKILAEDKMLNKEDFTTKIKNNNFSEYYGKFKNKFSNAFDNIKAQLKKKGYKFDTKLLSLHLNESLRTIILLFVAVIGLFQAYDTFSAIDKLHIIKQHYQLKKEIKIEDEKIKENIKAEYLADILRFGVKTENGRYPEGGYLEAFNQVFPDNISDLQLGTFLEGWGSEFIDYKGRQIRVDNGLIDTFKADNHVIDNGMLKGMKYKIVLKGEPDKVENFLYNIRYSNKIPKYFTRINKKYNSTKGILTVDMDVLFYLSK